MMVIIRIAPTTRWPSASHHPEVTNQMTLPRVERPTSDWGRRTTTRPTGHRGYPASLKDWEWDRDDEHEADDACKGVSEGQPDPGDDEPEQVPDEPHAMPRTRESHGPASVEVGFRGPSGSLRRVRVLSVDSAGHSAQTRHRPQAE